MMESRVTNLRPDGDAQFPKWMKKALSGFESDSRLACRGLQVSIAVHVFGVGTLLPNDLPRRPKSGLVEVNSRV